VVAALVSCVVAPPAVAQAATQVDPDSPAGVEYQLPLDRARQESATSKAKGESGSPGRAPLFGAGVEPVGKGPAKSETGRGSAGRPGDGSRSFAPVPGAEGSPVVRPGVAQAGRESAPAGLLLGGGAAVLLLLSAGVGLLVRRGQDRAAH
jgi:hypothetical protein